MSRPENMLQRERQKNEMFFKYQETQEQQTNEQQTAANQTVTQHRTNPYESMRRFMKPLPSLPNAAAQTKPKNSAAKKERKKQEKQAQIDFKAKQAEYMNLGEEMRLIRPEEMRTHPMFKNPDSVSKWNNEKIKRTDLTRKQLMENVLAGDYSQFENLDITTRNLLASEELHRFIQEYHITENTNPQAIVESLKKEKDVSGLLKPTLRLGLSLAQKTGGIPDGLKNVFRELDEAMTTEVMIETLVCDGNFDILKEDLKNSGMDDIDAVNGATEMVRRNNHQQIQMAKRLLLMQMSNFKQVEDTGISKDWKKSMAVAVSHCSRIVFTLPGEKKEEYRSKEKIDNMWKSIMFNDGGSNAAQNNRRTSSTHSLKCRTLKDDENYEIGTKEKKVLFNLISQRGMNVAVGGLGNKGIGGKMLKNNGSCGHMYSMRKRGNVGEYGAMLVGFESDAPGEMNQLGHKHSKKATGEKASSFGGQRTDEIGAKYGGRQCDLKEFSATQITEYMETLERFMLNNMLTQRGEIFKTVMAKLAGAKMDQGQLNEMMELIKNELRAV